MRAFTIRLSKPCELIPYVSFKYPHLERQLDLMIDSGSQGNVIRINVLPPSVRINYHDKIWIKGISNEHLITIGTVSLKIINQRIVFHVIQDELQIPYDGILGVEFLNINKAIMDFNNKNLYLNGNTIPFKQNIGYCKDNEHNKIFSINQHDHKESLPLINVVNRNLEYLKWKQYLNPRRKGKM